jgi:hypothetical protein
VLFLVMFILFVNRVHNIGTGLRRVWVMVECRGSRVIRRGSRVIGRGSRVIGRGSIVEVEGQKSRSRVKSRGRGSKVEGRNSRVENEKY